MTTRIPTEMVETVEAMIAGFGRYNLMAGWDVLAQEVPREPAGSHRLAVGNVNEYAWSGIDQL